MRTERDMETAREVFSVEDKLCYLPEQYESMTQRIADALAAERERAVRACCDVASARKSSLGRNMAVLCSIAVQMLGTEPESTQEEQPTDEQVQNPLRG